MEGTYTLASAGSADLALYCTTRGPSGPTPDQDSEHIKITRGAGNFHLYETNVADGWLHVSFYSDNSKLRSGVYFGEKGRENTLMRDQEWFREFAIKSPDKQNDVEVGVANARCIPRRFHLPLCPTLNRRAATDSPVDAARLLRTSDETDCF